MSIFKAGIIFYCIITFVIFIGVMLEIHWDIQSFAISPKEISEMEDLNIFGGICLSIVFFIISPWMYFCRFVYWIFHVGRRR